VKKFAIHLDANFSLGLGDLTPVLISTVALVLPV